MIKVTMMKNMIGDIFETVILGYSTYVEIPIYRKSWQKKKENYVGQSC